MPFASLPHLSLKRFRTDESGNYAVEFTLIAIPFLFLCYAIIETAVVMGAGVLLDYAVNETARQVMTGEVQEKDLDQTAFRALICDKVSVMLTCSKLKLDMRTFASGKDIPTSTAMSAGSVDSSKFCYDPGLQSGITVLRAFYEWPWTASFLQKIASDRNGNVVLFSMAAFMNEPYGATASTHANCA